MSGVEEFRGSGLRLSGAPKHSLTEHLWCLMLGPRPETCVPSNPGKSIGEEHSPPNRVEPEETGKGHDLAGFNIRYSAMLCWMMS